MIEHKIFKYPTKDKPKDEGKLRYNNGFPSNQIMNKPNRYQVTLLEQRLKKAISRGPKKITSPKYVHKRDNAKIESEAWEYMNEPAIAEDGKYDIENENIFDPEYTIKPQPPAALTSINADKFTTKLIKIDQEEYNFPSTKSTTNSNVKYQLQDTLIVNNTSKKTYDVNFSNVTHQQTTYVSKPEYRKQETNYDPKLEPSTMMASPVRTTTRNEIVLNSTMTKNTMVRKPTIKLNQNINIHTTHIKTTLTQIDTTSTSVMLDSRNINRTFSYYSIDEDPGVNEPGMSMKF